MFLSTKTSSSESHNIYFKQLNSLLKSAFNQIDTWKIWNDLKEPDITHIIFAPEGI